MFFLSFIKVYFVQNLNNTVVPSSFFSVPLCRLCIFLHGSKRVSGEIHQAEGVNDRGRVENHWSRHSLSCREGRSWQVRAWAQHWVADDTGLKETKSTRDVTQRHLDRFEPN